MIRGPQQIPDSTRAAAVAAGKHLFDDESGGTLVFSAFALIAVLGVAALGIDAAVWYTSKRQMQNVADAGVVSGVLVLARSGGDEAARQAVLDNVARNGFADGSHGRVTVNMPPASGPNAGRNGYVEVIVDRPVRASLGSLFHARPVTVRARAVAGVVNASANCVLGLDPVLDAAVEFTGSPDIELACGIASNSRSSQAVLVKGDAAVLADQVQAYGQVKVEGSGHLGTRGPVQHFSRRLPDPFEDITIPSADPACDPSGPKSYDTESVTLAPGLHCGGFAFHDSVVAFQPGVYVIDSGGIETTGGSVLSGSDVTFVFTSADPASIGGLSLAGGTVADLVAPGPEGHFPDDPMDPNHAAYAGMLFVQDPAAPAMVKNVLTGGSAMNFGGALYFPNQEIVYSGGSTGAGGCLQMVARKITFSGSASVNYDAPTCRDQGVDHMNQTRVRIVE